MSQQRIMYVCTECANNNPEGCGHFDPNDLRVLPDGRWLCESCFDDTSQIDRGNSDEEDFKSWSDLAFPPQYAIQPQCAPDREALVRAIQHSYARKDLEPTSATTLALYREDAENAADAVLALTRPLTSQVSNTQGE